MHHVKQKFIWLAGLCLMSFACGIHAETVNVAVAANFIAPLQAIARLFEAETHHQLKVSSGSSGKFYAQIKNGAPFQILLSADQEIPARLENEGLAVKGSRFTYATGQLVLWSATPGLIDTQADILKQGRFNKLAIANPKLAPYGRASIETLHSLALLDQIKNKIVTGENIAQAHQFVLTGNAEIGLIAASQVYKDGALTSGSAWLVPAELHTPIAQDAVLLNGGKDSPAATSLMHYLQSETARTIIMSYGYRVSPQPRIQK